KDETGRLRGGNPGVRLFEPSADAGRRYFEAVPAAEPPAGDALRVVVLHDVFGSDALAAASPPLAERVPKPYVALNAEDAREGARARGSAAGRIDTVDLD